MSGLKRGWQNKLIIIISLDWVGMESTTPVFRTRRQLSKIPLSVHMCSTKFMAFCTEPEICITCGECERQLYFE